MNFLHSAFYKYPSAFPLPLLLDGSTGTSLQRRGMPDGAVTEEWVLSHPDDISEIQRGYVAAGADALFAPTFGANSAALALHGSSLSVLSANERLADLTLATAHAAERRIFVGGDMSPTGRLLLPYGDISFAEMVEIYREQADALAPLVDFFVIETSISLAEVTAALRAVRSVSDKPVFVSLTIGESGRTMSGDALDAALVTLAPLGISAFGANCSFGPEGIYRHLSPIAPLAAALGVALLAKPNAGLPHAGEDGRTLYDGSPDDFYKYGKAFLDTGVLLLGGCCGTDREYIASLRKAMGEFEISNSPKWFEESKKINHKNLIASNRAVADISGVDFAAMTPIKTDDDFADNADCDSDFLYIEVTSAEVLSDNSFMLTKPLVLCGERGEIDKFLDGYTGKAAVI